MNLYRYEDVLFAGMPYEDPGGGEHYGASTLRILCMEYRVVKETPGGYWVLNCGDKKWVSKTARKRFAYPEKDLAWKSFRARKTRQCHIHAAAVRRAELALSMPQPEMTLEALT